MPRTICPGCNIQLEATVQFFELLVEGQRKIREMWKEQVECQRKTERERLKNERESSENHVETTHLDNLYNENGDEEFAQQIIIKSESLDLNNEKKLSIVKFRTKNVFCCKCLPLRIKALFSVLPDGSMYAAEHDMSLQMEGLSKPRRKRGRPPKNTAELEDKVM